MPHTTTMVTVLRTRHQGTDALYLMARDGTDLGWYDLERDSGHPGSELLSLVVDAAGAGWRAGSGSPLLHGATPLVTVSRWIDGEQDTLQVYAYDGTKLGVYDLGTQRTEPVSPYMDLVVMAAATGFHVGEKSSPRGARKSHLHITHVRTPESDRLLITSYDGVELGWFDIEEEVAYPASEIMSLVVEAAGLAWITSYRTLTSVPEPPISPVARMGSHLRALVSLDPRWSFSMARYEAMLDQFVDVFVVTGPGGVFIVAPMDVDDSQVAVHNETVWVNGSGRDHLGQAQYYAKRFSAHLSASLGLPVLARPVIAVFGATKFSLPRQPDRMDVVQGDCVVSWLRQRREIIVDADVLNLVQGVSEATWNTMRAEVEARRGLEPAAEDQITPELADEGWLMPSQRAVEQADVVEELHSLLLGGARRGVAG